MHHSDFMSHQHLINQAEAEERKQESEWIRRYHIRESLRKRENKQSKTDIILWILSIIMLIAIFNSPSITRFILSVI